MKPRSPSPSSSRHDPEPSGGPRPIVWIVAVGALVLLIALVMRPRPRAAAVVESAGDPGSESAAGSGGAAAVNRARPRLASERGSGSGARTPEQVVADKVNTFARGRRDVVNQVARQLQVTVSPEVQKFFDAVESGEWRDIKGLYSTLLARRDSGADRELAALWPAIRETYGVAEQSRVWPAQELLNYGQTVLGALPPGAVLVAGNDAARFIPTLVSETGGGSGRPVILPPDATDDPGTLEYLNLVHGERLNLPTHEAAAAAAPEDASATGAPSEEKRRNGGLLRALLEKNPATPLVIGDGAAATALGMEVVPRGPVMEVIPGGVTANDVTARAGETLAYWKDTAQRLQTDSALAADAPSRQSYADMAMAQADFYAKHSLPAEADQLFRYAREVAPAALYPVQQYAQYLTGAGRVAEAGQLLDDFARQNEEMRGAVEALRRAVLPK